MASDRFIKCKRKPNKDDIGKALSDYLGEALIKEIYWDKDRWFVTILGTRSHPLRSLVDADFRKKFIDPEMNEPDQSRWIEVWVDGCTVDVITRRQDELTNNIAQGFARIVARFWEGKLEG